jgi:hypothetical protein
LQELQESQNRRRVSAFDVVAKLLRSVGGTKGIGLSAWYAKRPRFASSTSGKIERVLFLNAQRRHADTPTRRYADTLCPRRYADTPIRSAHADTLCPRRHALPTPTRSAHEVHVVDQVTEIIARTEFPALDQNGLVTTTEDVTPELISNIEAPLAMTWYTAP